MYLVFCFGIDDFVVIEVFDVEVVKMFEVFVNGWCWLVEVNMICGDIIVGFGGGVIIDVVGFLVVIWM